MNGPEPQTRRRRWAAVMLILLLLVAGLLGVGAHAWKEGLRISHLRVAGTRILAEREVIALAGIARNERLFGVDLNAIRVRVEQNPFVRSASVNLDAPDGITITIDERVPVAAIAVDRLLYLDADGVVLPPAEGGGILDLPVVTGHVQGTPCRPGVRLDADDIQEAIGILTTARMIGDDLYHLISEIHLDDGKDIVLIMAESGVPVLFGHGATVMKLLTLDAFWKNIVAEQGAAELKSLDLRFADQAVARWQHDADVASQ